MPRIPYVSPEELPDSYDSLDRKSELPEGVDAEFWNQQPTVKTFSNNPELGKAHVAMNTELWTETGLSDQECECVILAIGKAMQFEYQWHDHVFAGIERAGLSKDEVLAISRQELSTLEESKRSLVEYAFEFVETSGNISEKTHEQIASQYDDEAIAGLAILSGYYVSMVHILRVLDIRLEEEFVGWELENYEG